MREQSTIFQGLWPALFTPVNPDGSLNPKELEKLVELLIAQKVDGLYLLGSTGQGFLFSEEERKQITRLTLEIAGKRIPVMVQVGALNTEESIRLARHAADHGADGISAVGPIYYGASADMAFEHYRRIAQATDVPFFPYQIGNAANMQVIDRLLTLPQVHGMKLTTDKMLEISTIKNRAGEQWKLFSGADELMCQAALCGTVGAIGTSYNLFGPTCKYIRESFLAGETMHAMEYMLTFQKFIETIIPVIWSFFNRAMYLRYNIVIGEPKPPLLAKALPWTDDQIMAMMEEIENFYTPVS